MSAQSLNLRRQRVAHGSVLLCLAAWSAASLITPAYVLPGPLVVLLRAGEFVQDINLFAHVIATVAHVLFALLIAFVVGTALAFMAFYFPTTRLLIEGRIAAFLNSFSSIGWAILAIIWFGLNGGTVVFVVAVVILPLVIINTVASLDNLDAELLEMGRSFAREPAKNIRYIVVPAVTPFMFATLRIGFGVAWKVTLTAELFGGNSGLGFIVNIARQNIDTPQIFAVILIMVGLFFAWDRLLFAPVQRGLSQHYAER